ncbi:MAG: glycoside hydrolase family 73 protein [Bacteroidia bacterium]
MNNVKISIAHLTKCCKVILAVLLVLLTAESRATKDPIFLTRSYINWYADDAIDQMVQHGIPASVTLAQAIFESRSGSSYLAKKSNNHFGIKCHSTWRGDTVIKTDDTLNECFRKYSSVEESYEDHSLFLRSRGRYAHLFKLPVTDYKSWCYGLKNSGYATFPGYADELIKIIEENKLYLYDAYEVVPTRITKIDSPHIIKSPLLLAGFTLKETALCDALFINEHDALIQSLDLITQQGEINEDIADK